jgi:hypothetical protein
MQYTNYYIKLFAHNAILPKLKKPLTVQELTKKFKLAESTNLISLALEYLVETGKIEEENGKFKNKNTQPTAAPIHTATADARAGKRNTDRKKKK